MLDAGTELLNAVRGRIDFEGSFELEEIRSRRWKSVTFSGARHELAFRLDGEGAGSEASRFLATLKPELFPLQGHLLAELSAVGIERRNRCARIRLDALTVEEAR